MSKMSKKMFIISFALAIMAISVWHANVSEAQMIYDGLISFWTFDESDMDDKTVMDVIGNNHGTSIGEPKLVDGWIGDALRFDGVDDHVDCKHAESLNLGKNDFTLDAWFNGGNQTSYVCIIEKGNPLCDGCPPGYAIYWYKNKWNFVVDGSGKVGDTDRVSVDATPYMDKQWHHIAGTRDKSGIHLYLDGALVASGPDNSRNVNVGANLWIGFNKSFNGAIDEVKIYSRALSEDEIQRNYTATSHDLAVKRASKLVTKWGSIKSQ